VVYGLGNFLVDEIGYRFAMLWIAAPPGAVLAVLILFTVKNKGIHEEVESEKVMFF